MAKISFRQKDQNNNTKGITVIHSPKGQKLQKITKIYKIICIISIIINISLVIKILY